MSRTLPLNGAAVGLLVLGCGSQGDPSPDPGVEAGSVRTQSVEIEYIGHASFLLRSPEGVEVLLDPYASRVWIGYDFPEGIDPDVVLITHPHYDHDAGRYRGAPFPWPDARVVDEPGEHRVGDVRIVAVEGKHADPYGMEFGQVNTIMVVEVGGLRIAHLGDNGPLSRAAVVGIGAVDLLMMPMDAEYHILSPEETARVREAVPHRWLVPMHYRLTDLEPDDGPPEDLGGIDPVLALEARVQRVGSHLMGLGVSDLPAETTVLVFERSPDIPDPGVR